VLTTLRLTAVQLLAVPALAAQSALPDEGLHPPPPRRELRGVWVATVNNLDWPSRPGLSTDQQQAELLAILDRTAALRMNAIVLQVRPEFDALYQSPYEPWSRYLTGRPGRAPTPPWDPLAFAVDEAHRRGLELHAWINPYRAAYWRDSLAAATHVSTQRPDLIRPYGQYLWADPGAPDARDAVLRVVRDIVRRYDVDGLHIDDYFYPYPELHNGVRIAFPDSATYDAYRRAGGSLTRADWRRANNDEMVRALYGAVKAEKPWVKVGVSPFGIWRPGVPPTTTAGLDQHEELFADVRKWLHEGWLDYLAPQLYWPVQPPEQSYPVLLRWWVEENRLGREVWPGLALYKLPITGPRKMSADDIVQEIELTRAQPGANGHLLFNARVLMNNVERIAERLGRLYAEPALVPAMPWLDSVPPARPTASIAIEALDASVIRFAPGDAEPAAAWVVQARIAGAWRTTILPGPERTHILTGDAARADVLSVTAVDRAGNASAPAILRRTP
jgi:uncharacterized lipoprotein YddW (UPF0748 family)